MGKTFKIWTEREKNYLINNFNAFSIGQIAKRLNRTIRSIYWQAGQLRLSHQEYNRKFMAVKSKQYTLNENYFEKIDSKDKAYFLGLLYADGYNHKYQHCVEISLSVEDEEILKKFKYYIKTKKPLYHYDRKGRKQKSVMSLSSEKLRSDLSALGCINKKSHRLSFPSFLPPELTPFFILGFFDGDGSCFIGNRKYTYKGKIHLTKMIGVNFTSCYKFILGLENYLKGKGFHFRKNKDKRKKDSWYLNATGKMALLFLSWLYTDKSIYLKRKYKKYLEMCQLLHKGVIGKKFKSKMEGIYA